MRNRDSYLCTLTCKISRSHTACHIGKRKLRRLLYFAASLGSCSLQLLCTHSSYSGLIWRYFPLSLSSVRSCYRRRRPMFTGWNSHIFFLLTILLSPLATWVLHCPYGPGTVLSFSGKMNVLGQRMRQKERQITYNQDVNLYFNLF